jgi:hypothetical protein
MVAMASTTKLFIAVFFVTCVTLNLSGCGSDGTSSTAASSAAGTGTPAATSSSALSISGTPAKTAAAGKAYNFRPAATDAAGSSLTFTVANKPAWATFNNATGTLSGTPAPTNVGVAAQIQISVSDGTHTAALAPFSITVAAASSTPSLAESVTLYWTIPADNSNGTPATNLAGYHVYYGTSAGSLTKVITVDGGNDTSQVIGNLQSGTWYFAVTAFNTEKIESKMSEVVPVTIT